MDGIDSNKGKLRQLPPWMLKVAATDKPVSKLDTKDNNKNNDVETTATRAHGARSTVHSIKDFDKDISSFDAEESKRRNSSVVTECEPKRSKKRTKRKSDREETDHGNNIDGSDIEKKNRYVVGRRGRNGAPAPRKNRKSDREETDHGNDRNGSENEKKNHDAVEKRSKNGAPGGRKKRKANDRMAGPSELADELTSEDELTVEDLISIAQEYIANEEQQRLSEKVTESSKLLLCTTSPESTVRDHPSDNTSSRNISAASHSTHTDSLRTESSIITSGYSGDAAQDMLDLFLGPLLRNLK